MESVPPEIRLMILNCLPNADLLKCSLVNKRLNYEARTVMRNRGSLLAYLGFDSLCGEMEEFVTMLEQMNIIPFGGVRFCMPNDHQEDCQPWSAELTNRIYKTLICCLSWKHISFDFGDWWENKNCPVFLLGTKILREFSGVLEKLSLTIESGPQTFIKDAIQDRSFPRLKTLSFGEYNCQYSEEQYTKYVKKLVSLAPNLQELHIQGNITLKENVLEGSSAVLWIDNEDYKDPETISEGLVGSIRMESFTMKPYRGYLNVAKYNRITPMLLQASFKTLSSMSVHLELALPLMCYGVRLENVRKFVLICNNYHQLEFYNPDYLDMLKDNFDFSRIFPSLSKVSISHTFGRTPDFSRGIIIVDEFVEQAKATLSAPLPDRAVNIKKLELNTFLHPIPFFREMFPDVETLSTTAFVGAVSSFRHTWKHWKHLKTLEIKINRSCKVQNLDSVFCGIFPQEVAELREKDEEFLKRVNIVPVMPSITCMKDLRNLKLCWERGGFGNGYQHPIVIFSKVTAEIAFGRCPHLTVTLNTSNPGCFAEMFYLKPYATVAVEPLERS